MDHLSFPPVTFHTRAAAFTNLAAPSSSIGLLWIQSGYPINVIFRPPNPYEVVWFVNLNATPPIKDCSVGRGGQWAAMLQRLAGCTPLESPIPIKSMIIGGDL